ncbi:Mdm33 family-domain-containing protein [Fusarium redolens]|jgi:sensitive to high expression protein 9, mitochondrial|uniref:Sensitive to high expression protein 9, mitochondrial n=1 Tax=Fusarium redolens TaxID=48865 RepID=A0A9P9H0K1_FUSRE|nr:Mdm33 family-domain-containing protein [Fusarium redolens]KAH7248928.1 Mdm33 family-domain-containing protein [Fusarium redolens]
MQPFARPAVRLVWSHARFGLDRSTRPGRSCWGPSIVQSSTICIRCNFQAIGPRARLYSTERPPRDSEKSSRTNKDVEDELESILKPRPNLFKELQPPRDIPKLEDVKSTNATSESAAPKDTKSELPKAETEPANSIDESSQSQATSGIQNLRHLTLNRMNELKERFSGAMDRLQSRAMNASQTLNDITGYTDIEAIKHQNAKLEADLAAAHERVREARQEYKTSNASRATTQREVTTLLARKDSWSPMDLERFTELYRADHTLEGKVASSQEALTEAETEEQRLSQQLNAGILKRYHEEQIWSDRIRRASTWGTWGLMGMNFLLFVILQFVAEPWKRRRLVRGVVAEEKAVLEEVRGELEQVKLAIENQKSLSAIEGTPETEAEAIAEAVASENVLPGESLMVDDTKASQEPVAAFESAAEAPLREMPPTRTWQEALMDPEWWRAKSQDIYSERRIDLRMRDVSLLVLEGALAGAVFTGSIALLMIRRS